MKQGKLKGDAIDNAARIGALLREAEATLETQSQRRVFRKLHAALNRLARTADDHLGGNDVTVASGGTDKSAEGGEG